MNWHYVPRERKGLALKDMTEPQRVLAMALLKSGLSDDGLAKAQAIQSLEEILRVIEEAAAGRRDREKHYVSVVGTPGGKDPWAWRWEGHHQSLAGRCPRQGWHAYLWVLLRPAHTPAPVARAMSG